MKGRCAPPRKGRLGRRSPRSHRAAEIDRNGRSSRWRELDFRKGIQGMSRGCYDQAGRPFGVAHCRNTVPRTGRRPSGMRRGNCRQVIAVGTCGLLFVAPLARLFPRPVRFRHTAAMEGIEQLWLVSPRPARRRHRGVYHALRSARQVWWRSLTGDPRPLRGRPRASSSPAVGAGRDPPPRRARERGSPPLVPTGGGRRIVPWRAARPGGRRQPWTIRTDRPRCAHARRPRRQRRRPAHLVETT